MLELYLDGDISRENLCHINFGLAKACEDLGDFEQAFTHYREGNEIRNKLLTYDINRDIVLFRKIKSSYALIERNSLASDNLSKEFGANFIVGMPRSGTTLVEQISFFSFASHWSGRVSCGSSIWVIYCCWYY